MIAGGFRQFLYGFMPQSETMPEDTVFCIEAKSVYVQGNYLVCERFPDGPDNKPINLFLYEGSRYWIVICDPSKVRAPNGSIAWQWPPK